MKTRVCIAMLLLAVCLLACASSLADDTVTADGLYSYQLNGENAVLTGYLGDSAELTLPAEAGGHPVTEVANYFDLSDTAEASLTALIVPEGYVRIGDCSFNGCPIVKLTLPSTLREIGENAFQECALEEISLPEGLEKISGWAFHLCPLKEVALPDSLVTLDGNPFSSCTSLTAITVSGTNEHWRITDGAVLSADGETLVIYPAGLAAESYAIPVGVTEIGEGAFMGASLKSVSMPETLLNIGRRAFQSCSSLQRVDLPESLERIDETAFYHCSELSDISLPQSLTYMGNSVFEGCSSLVSATIPDGIHRISPWLFCDCTALESVTLPAALTNIDIYAFSGCTSLSVSELPQGVMEIGTSAFAGCVSMTRLTLPDALKGIDDSTFEDCPNLVLIVSPGTTAEKYARRLNLMYEFPEGAIIPDPTPSPEIPEGTFVLREGITWNTTPEELAEQMNIWDLEGYESNGVTTYSFSDVAVSRYTASMICIYIDGRMVAVAYGFEYLDDMPAADAYLSEALSQKYGTPLEGREQFDLNILAIGIEGMEDQLQTITSVISWQAPDGTLICLAGVEEGDTIALFYLNTSRLTGDDTDWYNTDGL